MSYNFPTDVFVDENKGNSVLTFDNVKRVVDTLYRIRTPSHLPDTKTLHNSKLNTLLTQLPRVIEDTQDSIRYLEGLTSRGSKSNKLSKCQQLAYTLGQIQGLTKNNYIQSVHDMIADISPSFSWHDAIRTLKDRYENKNEIYSVVFHTLKGERQFRDVFDDISSGDYIEAEKMFRATVMVVGIALMIQNLINMYPRFSSLYNDICVPMDEKYHSKGKFRGGVAPMDIDN